MKSTHSKIRFFVIVCISILLPIIIAVSSYAENYPDINNIDKKFYYNTDYQFFRRPNSGYVLLSTNKINKSMAALLDENGDFDYSSAFKPTSINFVYENTSLCKNYLYIIGKLPKPSKGVTIGRLDLSNGRLIVNKIIDVECDFSREFTSDTDGKLTIYTAPLGQDINDISVPNVYIFDGEHMNISLSPQPSEINSEPDKNNPDEQNDDNSETDNTDTEKGGEKNKEPEFIPSDKTSLTPQNYYFDTPVTIDSLQSVLDENSLGQKLHVVSTNNQEVKQGYIGTGMTIKTLNKKEVETVYTAVVAGDLDGLGTVTNNDYRILYDYLTQPSSDKKEILSGPFYEAAKITDDLKADKSDRKLHTSDLLKIKKLIK